jgi:hypothetical protein
LQPSKRERDSESDLSQIVKVLSRLTLANSARIRDLTAATLDTYIVKADGPVMTAVLKAQHMRSAPRRARVTRTGRLHHTGTSP